MKYFNTLPKINYPQPDGSSIHMANLTTRVYLVSELIKSPLNYYQYDLQDTDTPEIVANKYYGSPENFWLVMLANQMLDPEWDWPLSTANLNAYIADKYGSITYAETHIHHYEKSITTTDALSGESETFINIIDQYEYANVIPSTATYALPSGDSVTEVVDKTAVTYYQYEYNLNESKRTISLINNNYVEALNSQFASLYANG